MLIGGYVVWPPKRRWLPMCSTCSTHNKKKK